MKIINQFLALSLMCSCIAYASAIADSQMICGQENRENPMEALVYENLNYGLAWFGKGNHCIQGESNNNPYFDIHKKHTLIFVHGWSPNTVPNFTRFNFNATRSAGPADSTDTISAWLDGTNGDKNPWNIGVFYWNQFADEPPASFEQMQDIENAVLNAENKIWSSTTPNIGMRWRSPQGFNDAPPFVNDKSVLDLLYNDYIKNLSNYQGDIRLVGESLGSQLVLALAKRVDDDIKNHILPANFLPKQIVLLDPIVVTQAHLDALINAVQQLEKDGVTISGYRTSDLGKPRNGSFVVDNTNLLKYTAFTDMDFCVYPVPDPTPDNMLLYILAEMKRHVAGSWWYFLSYGLTTPPRVITAQDPGSWLGPYANLDSSVLQKYQQTSQFLSDSLTNKNNHLCDPNPETLNQEWRQWALDEQSSPVN